MHRIKIKSPANFLWNEQHVFVCWFITFQSVLLWRYYNDKKSLPDIGGTTIQDVGCLAAMGLAMEPGVHTMSDELILQISCNIFLAFKLILMMRWCQKISHNTTAKLLVHVWNHDLICWQNKIETQKTFPQDYDYELYNLSITKIPITIVKAQIPSNPNQKSRTRDNKETQSINHSFIPRGNCHSHQPCQV